MTLAIVSAIARLVTYLGPCAATLALRKRGAALGVPAPTFVAPLGPVVPVLAITVSLAILAGASWEQLIGGFLALLAGAAIFALRTGREGGESGEGGEQG